MIFKALNIFEETFKAEILYKDELKTYGPVKAEELKRKRFTSRRAENKRKSRKSATLFTAVFSPIPLLWFLLNASGGAPIKVFLGAILFALFFWSLFYLLERVGNTNPYG